MSSQSKRRAESEEVTHKKKPRKEGEEGGDFNKDDGDELDVEEDGASALDQDSIIVKGRRTRVTKEQPDLGDDGGRVPPGDEEKGILPRPQTGSPQRKPAEDIEEGEEDEEEEEEEGEYGEDDDDDDADDDDEDEEE